MTQNRPAARRWLLDLAICSIVLMAAYAARGWLLAYRLGGKYPLSSLMADALTLGGLVLIFRAADAGIGAGLRWLIGTGPRRRRAAVGILRFGFVFALAAPFFVTLSQLHPQRIAPTLEPQRLGIPCEEVWLEADDLRLSAWHLPREGNRPPVLVLHGVGGNKQNFLPVGKVLAEAGHPVLLLDFRGHGHSEGELSTLGHREAQDVKAAHDWLVARYPGRPIHVVGYSMGAAAAVRAAAEYGIFDRLVLDSCFARVEHSVRHSAAQLIPAPLPAVSWYAIRGWTRVIAGIDLEELCPEEQLPRLTGRVLLIHGTADETTPYADSVRLSRCLSDGAALWTVEGAGHVEAMKHPEYASRLARFLGDG